MDNTCTKGNNNTYEYMTFEDRNQIYNEIVFALTEMKVYKKKNITIWELDEPDLKRFKIMLKLYRDYGKEFNGEFVINAQKRKMIYNLYNTKNKTTNAYISKI